MNYCMSILRLGNSAGKVSSTDQTQKNGNSHFGYQLFPTYVFPFEMKIVTMMTMIT